MKLNITLLSNNLMHCEGHTTVHQRVGHTISMPMLLTINIVFEHVWWGLGFDSSYRIVMFDPKEVAWVNMRPNKKGNLIAHNIVVQSYNNLVGQLNGAGIDHVTLLQNIRGMSCTQWVDSNLLKSSCDHDK